MRQRNVILNHIKLEPWNHFSVPQHNYITGNRWGRECVELKKI